MNRDEIKAIQSRLNGLDYDAGPADGAWGKRTEAAVRAFQAAQGLAADGAIGPATRAALASPVAKRAHSGELRQISREISLAPPAAELVRASRQWPHQRDCAKFYGPPGNPDCTRGSVKLPIKFRLAWDLSAEISSFKCHIKCAEAFEAIFAEAVAQYGEAEFRRLRLDLFGGCYNLRQMRGGSAWSMHSWGIAIDLDPERNQLKWGADKASFARPEYLPFWRIVEAQGAISLGRKSDFDWMHFQFARI